MKESPYYPQVELLLRCMPEVMKEACFSLKGGTAINLFVRNLPRLSVDIDLAYMPLEPREVSLKNVEEALNRISENIKKSIKGSKILKSKGGSSATIEKLFVSKGDAQIKIEPNPVIRGSVYPSLEMDLVKEAEDLFELSVSASVVSFADLYGGKLVAAFDRQHPRDLFDVKLLMDTEGISNEICRAFVVYLASHARPMDEVIKPTLNDMKNTYEKEFAGMTLIPFSYEDYLHTRVKMIEVVNKKLTNSEKRFLVSLQEGTPQWELLELPNIENLPALQWKLQNVLKMNDQKRKETVAKLKIKLEI